MLHKMAGSLKNNWENAGVAPASKSVAIVQYVGVTDSRTEALDAGERVPYVGRMAHHLRSGDLPMDGAFIRDKPFPGEQTIAEYANNNFVGNAHNVAERMIADIRRLNPSHYACNFEFGCISLERAGGSLERFVGGFLPLIENELGLIAKLDVGQRHRRPPPTKEAYARMTTVRNVRDIRGYTMRKSPGRDSVSGKPESVRNVKGNRLPW